MSSWKKAVLLAAMSLGLMAGKASAAGVGNGSRLYIDVTVNSALSVSVNGSFSSTMYVSELGMACPTEVLLASSLYQSAKRLTVLRRSLSHSRACRGNPVTRCWLIFCSTSIG